LIKSVFCMMCHIVYAYNESFFERMPISSIWVRVTLDLHESHSNFLYSFSLKPLTKFRRNLFRSLGSETCGWTLPPCVNCMHFVQRTHDKQILFFLIERPLVNYRKTVFHIPSSFECFCRASLLSVLYLLTKFTHNCPTRLLNSEEQRVKC
jgi:hypothetical protein